MREIKFRGKSLIPTVDLNYLNIEHNNGWVFGTYIDGYIVNDVIEANDEYITIGNWVPVDNVGQYTGLKDKNCVEIFEGDIVRFKFKNETLIGFVEYVRSSFLINARETICDNKIRHSFSSASSKEHEIIGNIYENNDLMDVLK